MDSIPHLVQTCTTYALQVILVMIQDLDFHFQLLPVQLVNIQMKVINYVMIVKLVMLALILKVLIESLIVQLLMDIIQIRL